MTIEAIITMILIFGICLGGFILFLYLSSKEN
jgi:GMP synthase-like glutamine amidotransferase